MSTETVMLPCGCRLTTGEDHDVPTFVIAACDASCENVRFVLDSAAKMGKPVEVRSTATITVTCLGCGKVNDASTPIAGDAVLPEPGSVSICMDCAAVAIYETNPDGDLYLRWPTGDEQTGLAEEPMITRVVEAIRQRSP